LNLHLNLKGYVIMVRGILWFCLIAMSWMVSVQASAATSSLHMTVSVIGEPAVRVLRQGQNSYVYWTTCQPRAPALQMLLEIELQADAYA
jgi:hypothetical protein